MKSSQVTYYTGPSYDSNQLIHRNRVLGTANLKLSRSSSRSTITAITAITAITTLILTSRTGIILRALRGVIDPFAVGTGTTEMTWQSYADWEWGRDAIVEGHLSGALRTRRILDSTAAGDQEAVDVALAGGSDLGRRDEPSYDDHIEARQGENGALEVVVAELG